MRGIDSNDHGAAAGRNEPGQRGAWTFLTNHAHVLLCIARDPSIRLRDVADTVGITERAAQSIVADLVSEGYLTRTRVGRRNQYEVHRERRLRHATTLGITLGGFLDLFQREVEFSSREPAFASAAQTNGFAANGNGYHGNN